MASVPAHSAEVPVDAARASAVVAPAPDPQAAIEAELQARSVAWEATFSKIQVGICAMGVVLAVSTIGPLGVELAVPMMALGIGFGLYFTVVWQLLARGLLMARAWAQWVNATIHGSIATAVLVVNMQVKGPEWTLTAPSMLLYSLIIALSAVRMRPLLCLFTGAVSIVEYLILYYGVVEPRVSAAMVEELPTLASWGVWHRCAWLAGTAIAVAAATHKLRALAIELGTEGQRRRHIEREFGRYVSRDVADAILSGDAQFGAAERREVSVLFCDLRDFTQLCEQESPEEVVDLLNRFYGRACEIVERSGGTVNKFMGDGMLALFGAPHVNPRHVDAAAAAATEIMQAAGELRRSGGLMGSLEIGVGLDTGPVVVGGIGADSRAEYTAIGTTVNRAARLQALSRRSASRIVLSETFARRLGRAGALTSLGVVELKGLADPVEVFSLVLADDRRAPPGGDRPADSAPPRPDR